MSPPCVTNTGLWLGLSSWLSTSHKIRAVVPRFFKPGILTPSSAVPVSGSQTPSARIHLVGAIPRVQEFFERPVISVVLLS